MLANPDIAYVLFVVGLFGLLTEICHPGGLAPGVAGGECVVLAAIAFTVLPVNLLGVLLLVAAVGLFALDATLAGHGGFVLLGLGGFVAGSLLLYGGGQPGSAAAAVSLPLVLVITVAAAAGATFLVRTALAMHRLPPIGGAHRLLGATGTVATALGPVGAVRVGGELWTARLYEPAAPRGAAPLLADGAASDGAPAASAARPAAVPPGSLVRVVGRRGLTLEVELLERAEPAA